MIAAGSKILLTNLGSWEGGPKIFSYSSSVKASFVGKGRATTRTCVMAAAAARIVNRIENLV
jgi:hypothetical protein